VTTNRFISHGVLALVAVGLLLTAASTAAGSTGIRTFYIDEAAGETGYTIEADWSQTGVPQATWDWDPPITQAYPPQGFIMLDGTLEITTAIPDGQMALCVRIAYDPNELRAIGWDGKKPPSMARKRMMDQSPKWRLIADVIRLRGLPARRKMGPADLTLGHYGVDLDNEYVWAVIDVPGTFAIGIPEPASLACLVGGLGVLAMRRSRRRAAG
jgi:hypothetical protein